MIQSQTDQPIVSIVIVVLNGAATIERALKSAVRHGPSLAECIVVDGGSTDGTLEAIKRYQSKLAAWVSEPDKGIYDAMNKAVKLASGRFIYFLGCDDELTVDLSLIGPILSDPNAIYYGSVIKSGQPKPYDGEFNSWKLTKQNICQQAIFYPVAAFADEQFSLKYRAFADWEFNWRCAHNPKLHFQYVPYVIASYGVAGISARGDLAFLRERSRLVWRYFPLRIFLGHILYRASAGAAKLASRNWGKLYNGLTRNVARPPGSP